MFWSRIKITLLNYLDRIYYCGYCFTKQSRPSFRNFWCCFLVAFLNRNCHCQGFEFISNGTYLRWKVGSYISAELGSMKVTEQIEAMEVSAINPFKYLVVTRVLATTITIPILALYCSFIGLLGSYYNVHSEIHVWSSFTKMLFRTFLFWTFFHR